MSPTTLILIVAPSRTPDGQKAYSTRGQLFDGLINDYPIVQRSTMPFFAAARALILIGHNPEDLLIMRHEGSEADSLTATLGEASKLTIWHDLKGRPTFGPWIPRQMLPN